MNKSKAPVALVTGASSGIGLITAQKLHEAGYRVFGTSRRPSPTASHLFEMLPLDVDKDESVAGLVNRIVESTGRIDLLVNNAGRGLSPAGAEEFSLEQAQAIFNTNFFGVVRATNAVLPHMRSQQRRAHSQCWFGTGVHAHALHGILFRQQICAPPVVILNHLITSFAAMGIRVSVIEPAFMKTSIEANSAQAEFLMDEYLDIRNAIEGRLAEMLHSAEDPLVWPT